MPIDFPNSPSIGTVFTVGSLSWIWTGSVWDLQVSTVQGPTGIQGIQGIQGVQGNNGTQGITGAQGTTGNTGSQGTTGTQGAVGTQGTQGVQGITGSQGTTGQQGITGAQGIQGITGSQGAVGQQGVTGTQGTQGIQGITGSQGLIGQQGVTGLQGIQGVTGSQGAVGNQGTIGAQGVQGITGSQGAVGSQGSIGATGSQGTTGATGLTGSQGTTGAQGITGSQGLTGSTGSQGATGATGNTGAQGIQGTTGATGATGSQGTTGSQGSTGTTGLTGAQGAVGSQGVTGATGSTGAQGATGLQGSIGATGSTGAQGTQGLTGATGATGSQGTTGATGIQGATGSQGSTGATGSQGIQGTTGIQGITGTTGAQGVQGVQGPYGLPGTGTTNYLAKWTGTSTLGDSLLFDNGTNVGVGTNTVYTNNRFAIEGSITGTPSWDNATLELRSTGGNKVNLSFHRAGFTHFNIFSEDGSLAFAQGGTENMRLTGGNLGVGTSSPGSRLEVAGPLGGTIGVGGSTLRLVNTDTGNAASITAGITGVTNDGMQFSADGTVRMVISGTGSIGIGTTSPGQKLHIANGNVYTDQGGFIAYRTDGGIGLEVNGGDLGPGSYIARFKDYNNNTKVVINGSGYVGIGTNTPGYQLEVNGWVGAGRYYPYSSNSTYIDGDGSGLRIRGSGYMYVPASGGSYFEGPVRFRDSIYNDQDTYLQINGGTSGLTYFGGAVGVGSYSIFHSANLAVAGKVFISNTNNSDIGGTIYGYNDSGYQTYAGGLKFQSFNNNGGGSYTMKDTMVLTGNGNLGLGIMTPTLNATGQVFHINGTGSDAAIIHLTNGDTGSSAGAGLIVGRWSDGANYLFTYNAEPIHLGTNGNRRFTVTSAGNVGIGTISPSTIFHSVFSDNTYAVNSTFENTNTGSNATAAIALKTASQNPFSLFQLNSSGDVGLYNTATNGKLNFFTNSAQRMTIDAAGNVGIGTTSPSVPLHVNGQALVDKLQYTQAIQISGGNLNGYLTAGFYAGSGLTNAPNSGWFFITVQRHSDTTWVHQMATSYGAGNTPNEVYTRVSVAGVWTSWVQLGSGGGATIGGSDNELLTSDGAGGVTAESNLTFDGATLRINGEIRGMSAGDENLGWKNGNTFYAGGLDPANIATTMDEGVTSINNGVVLDNWADVTYNGTVLSNQTNDGTMKQPGQLVALRSTGVWELASATSSTSTLLLGIALDRAPADGTFSVLIEGQISTPYHDQLATAGPGLPLFISTTAGSVTQTSPSTSGQIVRLIGHNLYLNTDIVVIRFNPDNTWIEL